MPAQSYWPALVASGITHVFYVTGLRMFPLLDAIRKHRDQLSYFSGPNETAVTLIAAGYGRAAGSDELNCHIVFLIPDPGHGPSPIGSTGIGKGDDGETGARHYVAGDYTRRINPVFVCRVVGTCNRQNPGLGQAASRNATLPGDDHIRLRRARQHAEVDRCRSLGGH